MTYLDVPNFSSGVMSPAYVLFCYYIVRFYLILFVIIFFINSYTYCGKVLIKAKPHKISMRELCSDMTPEDLGGIAEDTAM